LCYNLIMKTLQNRLKTILQRSGLFTIKAPTDRKIEKIKESFRHEERSFLYGFGKYLVDSLYCHASPGVLETIINELGDGQNKKLLNLGGGSGQVSSIFNSLGYDVYNIDLVLESENDHNLRLDLNKDKLPFDNQTFDTVIAQEIIEHLENPWALLREIKRILKPDGKLIISTPNILSLRSRLKFLWSGYFPWFTPDCFEYHVHPIPFWQLEIVAKQTGFSIKKVLGNGDYFFKKNNSTQKQILSRNEEIIVVLEKNHDYR